MAKTDIITGLDIGSDTIKVLSVRFPQKGADLEVLAEAQERTFGVRKGVVVNPGELANIIRRALGKIEEKIEREVDSAYINIGGSHVFCASSRGLVSVSRADQKISQEDIDRVLQAAQTFSLPSNREILDVLPKEFIIDGEAGIKEPQGLTGVRLETEALVLGGFSPYLKNLTNVVLSSDLQVNDLVFSPLACSRAVLGRREKELGSAVLDIGAGTTGLAVFEEGDLVHLAILPIGSAHITNDIAIYLKSDVDLAEKIKLEFGTLFFQGKDKKEKIELGEEETLIFSPKKISKVIEARVVEIFKEANKELKKIGKQGALPSGIVLTGGGARLPKIKEMAKKEFRLPCRLGFPKGFSSLPEDPKLSTVCGLVLWGIDLQPETNGWSEARKVIFGKGFKEKIKRVFRVFIP